MPLGSKLGAPAIILPSRPLSKFGAFGRGNQTGTGTPEYGALVKASTWATQWNGRVESDSQVRGGTGIYEIDQTLTWSMCGSLRMNGCMIKASSNFTPDATGSIFSFNNLAAAGYGAPAGRIRCELDINVWGPNGQTSLSKPPLTAVGATFTIVSLSGTNLVLSNVVGTIRPGQPVFGFGSGGSRGVQAGTWIVSGSGNTWTVNKNHVKPVAVDSQGHPIGTCQGYTTNDTTLNGVYIANVNDVDLYLAVQGCSNNIIFDNINWYTTRLKGLTSCGASQSGLSFSATNGNSGENIDIEGAAIFNCSNAMGIAAAIYEDGTSNPGVTVRGGSFDYCDYSGIIHGGDWRIEGHPENCSPNPMFYVTTVSANVKTRIKIDKMAPAFNGFGWSGPAQAGGRPVLFALDNGVVFQCDGNFGVFGALNTKLYSTTNGSLTAVRVTGWAEVQNNAVPYIGAQTSLIQNPFFDLSPFPLGWSEDVTPNSANANLIRNGGLTGAVPGVVGAGGQLPTNWSTVLPTGVTCTVGTPNYALANPTLPLTFAGTPSAGNTIQVLFEGKANIPAASPQAFKGSVNFAAIGTPTGFVANCGTFITGYANNGATFREGFNGTQVPTATQNRVPLPISCKLGDSLGAPFETTIAFGWSVLCTVGTPLNGTFQFDSPFVGMAGNSLAAPAGTNPAATLSPIRYYQDTSVTPFAGSHTLAVVALAANTTWPVAAGSAVNTGNYPGLGTSIKVRPGESLLMQAYVSLQPGFYGVAGALVQFFDRDGNPIGGTTSIGTGVSFPNALATVPAGGLVNGDSISVAGVTLTAGTDFAVTANQATDTAALLTALKAKGAPVNAATFTASTVAGAINITSNTYGATSIYTVSATGNIAITGNSGATLGPGTGGAAANVTAQQTSFVPQQASGSIAFLGAGIPGDQYNINGTIVTCVASGATGNQFNAGTSATTAAANLAAMLSASSDANIVQALYGVRSRPAGVVDVTFKSYGAAGNAFTLAYTPATAMLGAVLPGAVLVPGGTSSTTLKNGTGFMQLGSKQIVPPGADYARIYVQLSAAQGQANYSFFNAWST